MAYCAEITFRRGTMDEFTYEGVFGTLQKAVDFLNYNFNGSGLASAYINGVPVKMHNGCARGPDGEPLCTNPHYHERIALAGEAILPRELALIDHAIVTYMAELSLRSRYHEFLKDWKNPSLSFEEWKGRIAA